MQKSLKKIIKKEEEKVYSLSFDIQGDRSLPGAVHPVFESRGGSSSVTDKQTDGRTKDGNLHV